jgi:type IV secretion system protein VirB5
LGLIGLGAASTASAQFAVIDVGAIANLVQQLQTMRQQLDTTHAQLTQARQTLEAMRGGRGMERLLAGTVRNYLPPSWPELESAVNETSTAYGALASQFQALVRANAVLSPQALALLSERDRRELEAARRSAALMQVTTRQALVASSDRFNSLQRLIDAIPSAEDQKAVLDLQARIAAEQGMLMNEQIKLTMLNQAAQAEEQARKQRLREEALLAIGSLRDLPPIGL